MQKLIYKDYFDIDPDYFPSVNQDVIRKEPDLWKKFYPHDTFVTLLRNVVDVLTHKQRRNIWVEGAYGTGKSHAVLTLKRLLDASIEDTEAYFDSYPHMPTDLKNKFVTAKSAGKIVTVHRYGSSSINGDNDLFLAVQESIEDALREAGIENAGQDALKTGVVKYLSDPENKASFEVYVKGSYRDLFGGIDVDTLVAQLEHYEGAALQELMRKVFKVANEKQIRAFTLDSKGLVNWIKSVISANGLQELVFIWDEFTEYFENNKLRLTGFQEMLENAQTEPFCFIAVTHKSEALIESDSSKNKILDRFIKPTCKIELPENMAFKLMGSAMQKKADVVDEWADIVNDLNHRTVAARKLIKEGTGINDDELAGILPIQPYSAFLLKHIASSFNSNQRSMFDFIKTDRNDDIRGFQWFISNIGPEDENPMLTPDLLWDFFYVMGKDGLATNIRIVLDNYGRLSKGLEDTEKRVLKTILLFQALSLKTNDDVELLRATEKNLNNAFEGSDLDNNEAVHCAEKLVRDRVVFKRKQRNVEIYSVLSGEVDTDKIDSFKKQFADKRTNDLIQEGEVIKSVEIPGELKNRIILHYAGNTNFEMEFNKAVSASETDCRYIHVVVTFAKDSTEAASLTTKIKERYRKDSDCQVVVIDTSKSLLGEDKFAEWVTNKATSTYYQGKNGDEAKQYGLYASQVLRTWGEQIRNGQFVLFHNALSSGDNVAHSEALGYELRNLCLKRFPYCLEHYKVTSTMWAANQLALGVECGALEKTRNAYSSANANTKLENALKGAWGVEEYWQHSPSLQISRIKRVTKELIDQRLKDDGRIAISTIYDQLKQPPYAFLPCNITAFVLGFVLKEYVNGKYSWADSLSRTELNVEKLKEMVTEVIKNDITPNTRYRDKYIVTMSPEEKAFLELTREGFGIPTASCTTIEQAREQVRARMKGLVFPIWSLDYVLTDDGLATDTVTTKETINLYCDLANNASDDKSDSDIAIVIGKKALNNPGLGKDLAQYLTKDMCQKGMVAYLDVFNDGELPKLAKKINDGGQYINAVKKKFDADAAAWVWKKETVDEKIEEVTTEYCVIEASTPYIGSTKSISETIECWREKARNIRLPYQAIKNDVGTLASLLAQLLVIVQTGRLGEPKFDKYLENIQKEGANFASFLANQKQLFRKICDLYLAGLSDEDIDAIYSGIPMQRFALDNTQYFSDVEKRVEEYKKNLASSKLKAIWKEKTQTNSPREWSERYCMPISIMLDEVWIKKTRGLFGILNHGGGDPNSVANALDLIERIDFWESLSDEYKRDDAFRRVMIDDLSVMLPDIKEVKDYLRTALTDHPYDWVAGGFTRNHLRKLAERKYHNGGYEKAFNKIDAMDAEAVKSYLKNLIKNDPAVGMSIIQS